MEKGGHQRNRASACYGAFRAPVQCHAQRGRAHRQNLPDRAYPTMPALLFYCRRPPPVVHWLTHFRDMRRYIYLLSIGLSLALLVPNRPCCTGTLPLGGRHAQRLTAALFTCPADPNDYAARNGADRARLRAGARVASSRKSQTLSPAPAGAPLYHQRGRAGKAAECSIGLAPPTRLILLLERDCAQMRDNVTSVHAFCARTANRLGPAHALGAERSLGYE